MGAIVLAPGAATVDAVTSTEVSGAQGGRPQTNPQSYPQRYPPTCPLPRPTLWRRRPACQRTNSDKTVQRSRSDYEQAPARDRHKLRVHTLALYTKSKSVFAPAGTTPSFSIDGRSQPRWLPGGIGHSGTHHGYGRERRPSPSVVSWPAKLARKTVRYVPSPSHCRCH